MKCFAETQLLKRTTGILAFVFFFLPGFSQNTQWNTNGSIGIGAVSPEALLHVHQNNYLPVESGSKTEIARFSGHSHNYGQFRFQLRRWANGGDWYTSSARLQFVTDVTEQGYLEFNPLNDPNGIALGNGGTEFFRITSEGKVGIGTSSPGAKLQVSDGGGETLAYGSLQIVRGPSNDHKFHLSFIRAGQLVSGIGYGVDNNSLGIWHASDKSGMPVLSILPDQSIGICTNDTKGYKLAVNGDAVFTKIKIKQYAHWPDYVFDSSYAPLSLDSLSHFLATNKHLPEIPSEKEVKENGIDLGEMNALLLKKIEELTLYIIAQEKRILALENKTAVVQAPGSVQQSQTKE